MDLTSLYYFSELSKDLHITRTANRLYISQQTLSNHILRLEEYYGVSLLHRKPALSLTYAGEYVLAFAKTVLREEANLRDILVDVQHQERGAILFGASTLRMSSCLPSVLPDFSARYPNVEIRITNANSRQLEQAILSGDLDLAVVVSVTDAPDIAQRRLMSDQIYLCVTNALLLQYYGDQAEELKKKSRDGADIKDFSRLPFCMLNNRMGQSIKRCFDEAEVTPKVYTTSEYIQIGTSIGLTGLAACFATRTSLINQHEKVSDELNIFPLYRGPEPVLQEISIIHHKNRYLSSYSRCFMELVSAYFSRIEQLPIDRIGEAQV